MNNPISSWNCRNIVTRRWKLGRGRQSRARGKFGFQKLTPRMLLAGDVASIADEYPFVSPNQDVGAEVWMITVSASPTNLVAEARIIHEAYLPAIV